METSGTVYEIRERWSDWYEVSPGWFWIWTGRRRLNGVEYHGPVYTLGARIPAEGALPCDRCGDEVLAGLAPKDGRPALCEDCEERAGYVAGAESERLGERA